MPTPAPSDRQFRLRQGALAALIFVPTLANFVALGPAGWRIGAAAGVALLIGFGLAGELRRSVSEGERPAALDFGEWISVLFLGGDCRLLRPVCGG
jgi:hypothetical protein